MVIKGPDTNGSQIFVTTTRTSHLDGKHVAFGKVIKGMGVVRSVEHVNTKGGDLPIQEVVIADCGQLLEGADDGVWNIGKSLSLPRSSHSPRSEVQPTTLINYPEENRDISRCPYSLQDSLHFSKNVPDQNGLVDSSAGVITSEEHAGKTNWSDWDPLISFDDTLDPNWELD